MKMPFSLEALNAFIIRSKNNSYVGSAKKSLSYRPNSVDIQFHEDDFSYMDSYFGSADFIGQEVVYFQQKAVWAMNYYGRIIQPDRISPAETIQVIRQSLAQLYSQGRFLGAFEWHVGDAIYSDTNEGDVACFTGKEWISKEGLRVYELVYHGGLIK